MTPRLWVAVLWVCFVAGLVTGLATGFVYGRAMLERDDFLHLRNGMLVARNGYVLARNESLDGSLREAQYAADKSLRGQIRAEGMLSLLRSQGACSW